VPLSALALLAGSGTGLVMRTQGFLASALNSGNPLEVVRSEVDPPAGSIAYKLRHGEQVNLLLLGYGGDENDAPYLTDTMLVVMIDPASGRVAEVSIPRDLIVKIDGWNGRYTIEKINAAFEYGRDEFGGRDRKPEYTGKHGGGRLAEHVVSNVTGLTFDKYAGMDFKAFRDMVDALGGIEVCLDTPLDDNLFPDYHDGYIKGGVHFPAGCQRLNGERALQLTRSRHALQPEHASDFGRTKRQQVVLNAIRKKAASVNGLTKAPALMDALQKNFMTDMDLADLTALYRWSAKLPDSSILRVGLTQDDLVNRFFQEPKSCGAWNADVVCPIDPTFKIIRSYIASIFVQPPMLAEKAPIQIVNASAKQEDMAERVTRSLQPLGLNLLTPVRRKHQDQSFIYDNSGGRYPETVKWLERYFGARVVSGPDPTPTPGQSQLGLVVVLGRDYAFRWIGQA
jgi:LCP family protein required for cell wall assembly